VSDLADYFIKHRSKNGHILGFLALGVTLDIVKRADIDGALYDMPRMLLEYGTLDWYFDVYQKNQLVFTDCRRHLNVLKTLFDVMPCCSWSNRRVSR
jgi:hypothetical protein